MAAAAPVAELAGTAVVIFVLVSARVVAWHPDSPVADRVTTPAGRIAVVAIVTAGAIVAVAEARSADSAAPPQPGRHPRVRSPGHGGALRARRLSDRGSVPERPLGAVGARAAWGRSADLPHVVRARPSPGRLERPRRDRGRGARHRGPPARGVHRAEPSLHAPSASFVVPAALALAVYLFARRSGAGLNPARASAPTWRLAGFRASASTSSDRSAASPWPQCSGRGRVATS